MPEYRVVVMRDASSRTGWAGTWLRVEDGRVMWCTATPVDPQPLANQLEDDAIERYDDMRAARP